MSYRRRTNAYVTLASHAQHTGSATPRMLRRLLCPVFLCLDKNPHNSSRIVADDAKRDLPRRTHGCAAASMGAVLPKAVQARRPHKNRTDSVESLCSGFVSTLVQYLRTFVSPACARRCSSWLSRQKSNARPASRPILGSPKLGFTPKGLSQGSGD